eukprot:1811138-Prymnesium_polylepis.1
MCALITVVIVGRQPTTRLAPRASARTLSGQRSHLRYPQVLTSLGNADGVSLTQGLADLVVVILVAAALGVGVLRFERVARKLSPTSGTRDHSHLSAAHYTCM